MTSSSLALLLVAAVTATASAATASASPADVDQIDYVAIQQIGSGNQATVAGGGRVTLHQSGSGN